MRNLSPEAQAWIRYILLVVVVVVGTYLGVDELSEIEVPPPPINISPILAPAPTPETGVTYGYQTDCYATDGGDKWQCDSGGEIEVNSGATLDVNGTADFTGGTVTIPAVGGTLRANALVVTGTTESQGAATLNSLVVTGTTESQGAATLNSLVVTTTTESQGAATLSSLVVTGTSDLGGNISSSTGGITLNDTVNATGAVDLDSTLNVDAAVTVVRDTEHFGITSFVTESITYTAGAGTSGTLLSMEAGTIYLIHAVFIHTTETFTDTDGDDEAFTIGDANDVDGFLAASSTELDSTFTEDTGFAAGFYGIENGSGGAYTTDDGGPFVYNNSGAETIDYDLSSGAGDDIGAGALTMYIIYTRIQ